MKRFAALILALVLVLALAGGAVAGVPDKPSAFSYAYDFTGKVLSDSDISEIAGYGQALYDATGVQAIAVVVDFLDGADPADYATDIINTWGVGSSTENDGVVVLLARGDRKVQIGTGTGIDRVLTGSRCGKLIDESIDYFANNPHRIRKRRKRTTRSPASLRREESKWALLPTSRSSPSREPCRRWSSSRRICNRRFARLPAGSTFATTPP